MKPYYKIGQISKQAFHKYHERQRIKEDRTSFYISMIHQARELHPVIGLSMIWHLFKPEGIGREAFEHLGRYAGYGNEIKAKTTFRGNISAYDNLLVDKYLTGSNQVWVTDITYYLIKGTYYYISMIMDLYLRKIIACDAAPSLHASHSIKLVKKALRGRCLPPKHELIHHSDKGTQYTSIEYTQLLSRNNMGISMCRSVYENTHMERLNGIIKNDYLIHWNPKSYTQLVNLLKRAVRNYNDCPHGSLGMLSPNQYEQHLKNVPLSQRTRLKVFTFKKSKNTVDPMQLFLFNH